MSDEILQGNDGGVITVTRESGSTFFGDHAADGSFAHPNRLVEQTARERSHLGSRGRGIAKETDEVCDCPAPAKLRGKDTGHCANCGGRIA